MGIFIKYFRKEYAGVKAALKAHTDEQIELESRIKDLQSQDQDAMTVATINTYKSLLCRLLASKADLLKDHYF